jgi:non-specific serine/threonine protein kinase/serine/threonine-protein kinase
MTDERWERLRTLFAEAHDMPDSARGEFLDKELDGEPELRAELESLLASSASAAEFLAPGAPEDLGTIGPYRLVRVLGEGGFGVVYLADQLRPIRRRVALKLIKPGMDTKRVIGRFETERQALAMMDHRGIAQVFDAGETSAGRPYFAMEYVDGIPITTYCDRHRLRIRDRLQLFLEVCGAVQHAHQKGLIHRDIKPSNILVAQQDGAPVPKIIDFGIAKAMEPGSGDPLFSTRMFTTHEGVVVGTLGAMSPEQAGAIEAKVDTRSDIYSLGVVLYELLAGMPPFDPARLRDSTWTEAVRVIREEDPPALTARVAQSSELGDIAKNRSTEERSLSHELKGDLEWITMRTLEKEPERRYAAVSELAADIRRHLANEPVLAAAPSTMYRLRKYARRHRAGVTAAALVLAALVAGGIAAGVGFTRALHAERVARREAESASRVTDFLAELFESSTPDRSLGESVTARTLLDVGARRVREERIPDPEVRARLLSTIGAAYNSLGLFDEGLSLLEDGVRETEIANGPRSLEYGRALAHLAEQKRITRQGGGVDSLINQSIEILSDVESPIALASSLRIASEWKLNQAKSAEADSLIRAAIDLLEGAAHPDTSVLIAAYTTRGNIAGARYAFEEQERDHLDALALATTFHGERNSRVLILHRSLARLYLRMAKPDEAMQHAERALTLARAMYPEDHPVLAAAIAARGDALISAKRWDEAIEAVEESQRIYRATYGEDHPLFVNSLYSLAAIYESTGRLDLAIEKWRECIALRSRIHGPTHPLTAELQAGYLARLLAETGARREAESLYRETVGRLDPGRPHVIGFANMGYANLCRESGRLAEADSLYASAEAMIDSTKAALRHHFGICLANHAYARALRGRQTEAEAMMEQAIAMQLEDAPPDSPDMLTGYLLFAAVQARGGEPELAIERLRSAVPCGGTWKDVAAFPDLARLRDRADFPGALLPHATASQHLAPEGRASTE